MGYFSYLKVGHHVPTEIISTIAFSDTEKKHFGTVHKCQHLFERADLFYDILNFFLICYFCVFIIVIF